MADDLHLTAGEYVLGTLVHDERRAFARQLLTDPQAVAAVVHWQERLAPLALVVEDVAPSETLWQRIEAATGAPRAANDNGRTSAWRGAAIAASLVALVTSGLALRPVPQTPIPVIQAAATAPAVAALSADGSAPALLVTWQAQGGQLQVTPVSMADRPGHSLELWMIVGKAAPKSVGLMGRGKGPSFTGLAIDPATNIVFAVSVEPIGGSPTGAPTGPVIYSGKMVAPSPAT